MPSLDIEPIESTPASCFPASVIPDGLTIDSDSELHVLLEWFELQLRVPEREPLRLVREPLVLLKQAADHAHRLVLPVA